MNEGGHRFKSGANRIVSSGIYSAVTLNNGECVVFANGAIAVRVHCGDNVCYGAALSHANNELLATAGGDAGAPRVNKGGVRIWSLKTRAPVTRLEANSFVYSLQFDTAATRVLAAEFSGAVTVHHMENKEASIVMRRTDCAGGSANSAVFSHDEKSVFAGYFDGQIWAWCATTGRPLFTLNNQNQPVICVNVSPCGKYLVSGDMNRAVKIWDLETHACVAQFEACSHVSSVEFSADGKQIIAADSSGQISVLDVAMRRLAMRISAHRGSCQCAFVPRAEGTIVSVGLDHSLRVMDTKSMIAKRRTQLKQAAAATAQRSHQRTPYARPPPPQPSMSANKMMNKVHLDHLAAAQGELLRC